LKRVDKEAIHLEDKEITPKKIMVDQGGEQDQRALEGNSSKGESSIRVPLPQFSRNKNEHPNIHVAEFVSVRQANKLLIEEDRKIFFPCTLKGVAMDWYA